MFFFVYFYLKTADENLSGRKNVMGHLNGLDLGSLRLCATRKEGVDVILYEFGIVLFLADISLKSF